jgi:serine protease Do
VLLLAAALVSLAFVAEPAQAQKRDPAEGSGKNSPKVLTAFKSVVAAPSESTVRVLCDNKDAALGTIVEVNGWILTKYSELKGDIVCRLKDGTDCAARLVGVHEACDLALLKIEANNLKPVKWRDPKETEVGNWVASVGPGELPVAVGVVSVAARKVTARDLPPATNPNSGYLGVMMEESDDGVRLSRVETGTPASKAGLKAGDIVLSIDGKPIRDLETMSHTIGGHKPGDTVMIHVRRGDEEKDFKATLDKRPASSSRGDVQNRMGSELSNKRGGFPAILQHDTVIKPSDCGGPLVDLDGKALGINIARAGRVESYAIPADLVQSLIPDMKAGKFPPPKKDSDKKEDPPKK